MNKQTIRITFVISSLGSGGAERVVANLANELVHRGYIVSVLLIVNRNICYPLSDKVALEYLDCEKDNALPILKRYPIRLKKIKDAVNRLCPDIVLSFMSETNTDVCFALRGMKQPIIVSERNDPALDPPGRARQAMRSMAYRKPTGFVFQTPDARAYFPKRVQRKSRLILNPVSEELPPPHGGRRDKRIVAVGRLYRQKNYGLLIDAFALFAQSHPEYVLEIFGEGPLKDEIVAQISAVGMEEKVFLRGFCADVHCRIRTAAMFVLTSDFEGMPNALLEAMCLGLPCISTDCPCGGPRLLIQNGVNGILVPPKACSELALAMKTLANDPALACKIGETARLLRNKTAVKNVTDEWVDLINDCREACEGNANE